MAVSCEFILSAFLVIITGLLFIDLVPLQETMLCPGNYTNAIECPEVYYSSSYQLARERFLAAAEAAHAQIEHHLITKRGNEEYYMDTAFFAGKRKDKLLVHTSGTHGVEGFTGSAIQVKLLQEWNETALSGPSILFVHAVNPHGMAHFRRFNEENVDLNRNYLSTEEWAEVKARDANIAGYEDLRPLLVPQTPPRFIDRYVLLYVAAKTLARHGFVKLKRAFVTGQYHDPAGINYGGDREQKSISVLREVLKKHAVATGATEAVYLDVHTGLGPTGVDTMMMKSSQEAEKCRKVFPGARIDNSQTATSGPSAGYNLAAGSIRPVAELGPNTLAVTEEFGTVNPLFVARAVILENAAYRLCRGSYVHAVMQSWMRDVFYPQEISYKRATLKRGSVAFWKAWTYLAESQA
ncbi:hypothetical protein, conserved [Leishmania donovani]|uniref:DUF2817 domain-containing protein n=1 Tax=Leishmania donovani TaxID=5661 RepID=A0A3Q8II59_LEIDO|nr:hypothetical protein, conserved [Leishmania donovani]AYU81101.1 Protein of unknown function (DUF2817), putative [Leishmania donovani]TPP45851.1 hypothetical protein CGC21_36210 [Leishmania donovani]CBZ36322.1 hypothetical protein, conserved [Leishmania donovani]